MLPVTVPAVSPAVVVATAVVVVAAGAWDVRSRRIPNVLTFPAIGAGLVIGAATAGGWGLLAALGGAVLAPVVLMVLRLGNRLGMGDLKLAAAVGALTGPAVGALAMLLATLTGGLLAIGWMLRPGTSVAKNLSPFLVGLPIVGRRYSKATPDEAPLGTVTIPYGVAIGIGSLLAVAIAGTR
ncbi:MAG TPA: A24 family peptidase [bacterium]|nr:A24 family peptidase [bacterium]